METRRSFRSGAGLEEMMAVRRDGDELWSYIALLVPSRVRFGSGVMGSGNYTGIIDFN